MKSQKIWTRLLFAVSAIVLCGGCAEVPFVPNSSLRYERMVSIWQGKDINDLIYAWGPPNSTFKMPNTNQMFTWDHVKIGQTVTNVSSAGAYLGEGISVGSAQTVSTTEVWDCHTTIIANSTGTVIGWKLKGNSCMMPYSATEYAELQQSVRKKCGDLPKQGLVKLRLFPGAKSTEGDLFIVSEIKGILLACKCWFQGYEIKDVISFQRLDEKKSEYCIPVKYVEDLERGEAQ